jgi:hypothetical protein
MRDDPRGFLISMDLLFAIIPLTIVLGMVAADMGNILYEIEGTIYQSSTDRIAEDTLNTLAETSGDPPTWEQTGLPPNIVGLAQYNPSSGKPTPNTLDPNKLALLTNSSVQNLIGINISNNTYTYYLTINSINTTSINETFGNNSVAGNSNTNISNIVRVDKVVLCSKLESVTSLVGQIFYSGQTRIYTVPSFNTSSFSIQNYDYYILFVNTGGNSNSSATVDINNNPINLTSTYIFQGYGPINSTFLNTNSSNPNIVTLNITTNTIGSSMDFYIVEAPKYTNSSYITNSNVVPQDCNLTLYLWT